MEAAAETAQRTGTRPAPWVWCAGRGSPTVQSEVSTDVARPTSPGGSAVHPVSFGSRCGPLPRCLRQCGPGDSEASLWRLRGESGTCFWRLTSPPVPSLCHAEERDQGLEMAFLDPLSLGCACCPESPCLGCAADPGSPNPEAVRPALGVIAQARLAG